MNQDAQSEAAVVKDSHDGDCTIYACLENNNPTDGICTCGYGWRQVRKSDWSHMFSKEREHRKECMINATDDSFEEVTKPSNYNDRNLRYPGFLCGDELLEIVPVPVGLPPKQTEQAKERYAREWLRDLAPQGCVEQYAIMDGTWAIYEQITEKLENVRIKLTQDGEIPSVGTAIKVRAESYRANFLWPHKDGSVEQAGYEFVNGLTEEYRRQWWEILIERIAGEKESNVDAG